MTATNSWESTQSSGSSSSSKYNLDVNDKSDILVYRWRGGLTIESQQSLAKILDKEPRLRCARKKIPRGDSRIEVRQEDLFPEPERTKYQHYPNMKSSLASVGLPRAVYWKRLLMDQFQDLYIVSPSPSPSSSPESSMQSSRNNTFPEEGQQGNGATAASQ